MLKAGLVDNKKAKNCQNRQFTKSALAIAVMLKSRLKLNRPNRKSWQKIRRLNERKSSAARKELKAAIMQMINQHKIRDTDGEIAYQFIDDSKIKKVYLNQQIYNALVAGSLVIARENESYAFRLKRWRIVSMPKCKALSS